MGGQTKGRNGQRRPRGRDQLADAPTSASPEEAPEEDAPFWSDLHSPKFWAIIELLRPFTLLAPLIGGLSAALIAFRISGGTGVVLQSDPSLPLIPYRLAGVGVDLNIISLVMGVSTLVMINAASNSINQVYDLRIDRINKPYRPIPSGRVTTGEARTVAMVLYFAVLWRATLFRGAFGSLVLVLVIVSYLYSAPPVRFKKRLWGNNLSIAYARGLVGFLAGYAILAGEASITPLFPVVENPTPWAIGVIMGVFLIGATTTKDYADIEGDRRFGMRTLPVHYGPIRASYLSLPFFILPFLLLIVAVQLEYLIPQTLYLLPLQAWALYAWWLGNRHLRSLRGGSLIGLENSPAWVHMYLVLIALQIGFATIYWVFPT